MLNDAVTPPRPHALCKKDCRPHGSRFGARRSGGRTVSYLRHGVASFASTAGGRDIRTTSTPRRPARTRTWAAAVDAIIQTHLARRDATTALLCGPQGRRVSWASPRPPSAPSLCSKYNYVRLLPSSGTSPRKRAWRDVLGLDVTLQPRTPFWGAKQNRAKKRPQQRCSTPWQLTRCCGAVEIHLTPRLPLAPWPRRARTAARRWPPRRRWPRPRPRRGALRPRRVHSGPTTACRT